MKELYKQANNLVQDAQVIADEIFKYNPGATNGKKMSIKCIQHLIACLARGFAVLYGDIGEKDK